MQVAVAAASTPLCYLLLLLATKLNANLPDSMTVTVGSLSLSHCLSDCV